MTTNNEVMQATWRQLHSPQSVAHDLRQQLAAIAANAEAALHPNGAHLQPRALERVLDEALIMDELLRSVYNGEAISVEARSFDLAKMVQDHIERQPDYQRSRVTIEVTGPSVMFGYELPIRRLVANLMSNALWHTEESVEVTIKGEGETVVLEVSDNGAGFEALTSAMSSRPRDGRRGLSIAMGVADLHSADLLVTRRLGGGTTVTVGFRSAPSPRQLRRNAKRPSRPALSTGTGGA